MRLRSFAFACLLLLACGEPPPAVAPKLAASVAPEPEAPPAVKTERFDADSPRKTTGGTSFLAPAGWTLTVKGPMTLLEPPEQNSHIALVDVKAADADAAVEAAWKVYAPVMSWPLEVKADVPDKDGWTKQRRYSYRTSPNERRDVTVAARFGGQSWTVIVYDMQRSVGEKRMAAIALISSRMLPAGYQRESFAGRHGHRLDAEHLKQLTTFTETAMKALGIAGAALGVVQDGKVVFADGFGVRELGKADKPDADTLFMIASNTKPLTTLMLAKLVDEKKLTWDTRVTKLLPSFKLGNPETTNDVLVKHLICACTGMPRQDLEWIFEFKGLTAEGAMKMLGGMAPTSPFGEMFQYSNPLAAAGGFVGGHVANPNQELGAAYDDAMRTRVFEPLGMKSTTFDYEKALSKNHALPYGPDLDGVDRPVPMGINYAIRPMRPAGGVWSNVRDLLAYVQMELSEGKLPNDKPYIDRTVLLERRIPQVAIGADDSYGMGLFINNKYGIPIVHHGGDVFGYHSDMMWLPEQRVGLVILTNDELGTILRTQIRRKLLEVLFDAKPEADADVAAAAKTFNENLVVQRKQLTIPVAAAEREKLGKRYRNEVLGDLTVTSNAEGTTFDFGEWKSAVGSSVNPDGTLSFRTIAPGITGLEFIVGDSAAANANASKKTLTIRDAQHEYIFTER